MYKQPCARIIPLLFFLLFLIPSLSAVSEEEIRQAIQDDPKLYRHYHDEPEELISLIQKRPVVWENYQKNKVTPILFDLHVPEEKSIEFQKRLFLSGIKQGRLSLKLDKNKIPSSLKNARLNIKIDNEIIGVVLKNGQITTLQIGELKDHTATLTTSDTAIQSFFQGSFDIENAVKQKQIVAVKPDGSAFEITKKSSKSIVGAAISASRYSNPDGGILGILIVIGILVLALFSKCLKKSKIKKIKMRMVS